MHRTLRILTSVLFLAASPIIWATPIPTGTAANDLIINFNFLSPAASPAPPYSSLQISLAELLTASPTTYVVDLYGDLNGLNFLQALTITVSFGGPSFTVTTNISCLNASGICASIVDGVFSVGLHLTQGVANLTSASAVGTSAAGVPTGTVVGTTVPEPATLALLGLGLFGLALTRCRVH